MTREEAISKHRKMWNWLAENPRKSKRDYFKEFDPEAELKNDFYLCEYVIQNYGDCATCAKCPVEWRGGTCFPEGMYATWCYMLGEGDYTRAAEIARTIAELPERRV